jgi:hypothetical protein
MDTYINTLYENNNLEELHKIYHLIGELLHKSNDNKQSI